MDSHHPLYRRFLVGYLVLVAVVGLASALTGVSVPGSVLIVATTAMFVASAFAVRRRVSDVALSPRAPVAAAVLASIGTLIVLHIAGVPPQYSRASAVLVFGLAAYPHARDINDQIPPFPVYCGLWLAAAAGMMLSSHV